MKKFSYTAMLLMLTWLVFAQSCMFFRTSDKKAADTFNANGVPGEIIYQEVSGLKLHYVKTGNSQHPTIFFIHGSPGSWDAFSRYLQDSSLLAKFRMISIDRPGFGYSNFGHALNLDEQSALITEILKTEANKRPVYLVGHSLGGPLCVRLAIDNAGMASGLVLLSAAVDPALETPERWRLLLMNNLLQYLVPGALRPSNYELWYLKADLRKLQEDLLKAKLPPVWMIHGDKDNMVPYANTRFAEKYFQTPQLKIITIEGANHFIPWSNYDRIREVLLQLPAE